MPAKSKKQQRFMGMVHNAKKTGKSPSPEVARAAESMSDEDAKDFASTKHDKLPEKKKEKTSGFVEFGRKMAYETPSPSTHSGSKPLDGATQPSNKDSSPGNMNISGMPPQPQVTSPMTTTQPVAMGQPTAALYGNGMKTAASCGDRKTKMAPRYAKKGKKGKKPMPVPNFEETKKMAWAKKLAMAPQAPPQDPMAGQQAPTQGPAQDPSQAPPPDPMMGQQDDFAAMMGGAAAGGVPQQMPPLPSQGEGQPPGLGAPPTGGGNAPPLDIPGLGGQPAQSPAVDEELAQLIAQMQQQNQNPQEQKEDLKQEASLA